jgi:hypothetical protein
MFRLLINYYWGNKIRRMRLAGHVARMEERRGAHRVSDERPEGKIPLR